MSISCFALEFQKKRIAPNKKPLNFIQIQGLKSLQKRRMRDSNPHRLAPGGFQDRCNTNYANPPAFRIGIQNYEKLS